MVGSRVWQRAAARAGGDKALPTVPGRLQGVACKVTAAGLPAVYKPDRGLELEAACKPDQEPEPVVVCKSDQEPEPAAACKLALGRC